MIGLINNIDGSFESASAQSCDNCSHPITEPAVIKTKLSIRSNDPCSPTMELPCVQIDQRDVFYVWEVVVGKSLSNIVPTVGRKFDVSVRECGN